MNHLELLTPRQRETWTKVEAYRKSHQVPIQVALKRLQLSGGTYANARQRMIHGKEAYWAGNKLVPRGIASDKEAFSYDDD